MNNLEIIKIKKIKDFIKSYDMGECLEGKEKNIAKIELIKDGDYFDGCENYCYSIYIQFKNENFFRDYATNEIAQSSIKNIIKKFC